MDNNRKQIIVHLVKTITYPKAALDRSYPFDDARQQAIHHLSSEIGDMFKNGHVEHLPADFFDIEIKEESPFVLRETIKMMYEDKRGNFRNKIILEDAVRAVSELFVMKKFNNDIYITEGKEKKLKPECDDTFNDIYYEVMNILKTQRKRNNF